MARLAAVEYSKDAQIGVQDAASVRVRRSSLVEESDRLSNACETLTEWSAFGSTCSNSRRTNSTAEKVSLRRGGANPGLHGIPTVW